MASDPDLDHADESGIKSDDAAASKSPPLTPSSVAGPLPNIRGVGAFLAGLEQKILGRQPVQDVVQEHSLHNRRTIGGVTLEFDPDPPQRPEPEDHSGAKL
jgi:hypothetical protein